jgi:TPR repeat protein
MGKSLRNLGCTFIVAVTIFAVLEAGTVIRWLLFNGPAPSMRDLEAGVATVALIWLASKVAAWFETREKRHKELLTRIRDIDTRLEALYKWGSIVSEDGEDEDDLESEELDDSTKAKIAKCSEDLEEGGSGSRYNLGVTYWNLAMGHYNHSESGYRKAIPWLRKAANLDYNCEDTLGDAYRKVKDYDRAMYWYLRSVKRGGNLVWIPESNIGEMYAEGEGVSQNYAEAARWWTRSAQHGSDWCQLKLGKLYAEGADGVEKDKYKAYFHLYIASCATGENSPQKSAVEPLAKAAKELGEYFAAQEKKRAEEWLAIHKQKGRNPLKPLPLPQ